MTDPLPILENDLASEGMIEPAKLNRPRDVPEACVVCFFKEVVEKIAFEQKAKVAATSHWEDGQHPLYEINLQGRRLAFFFPEVGAALSASLLEELIAYGCRKFIVCGGCGVLVKEMSLGHLLVIAAAVRSEGVSYHYLPPGRTVEAHPAAMAALEKVLERNGLPYQVGMTWTTDAPYRETPALVTARRQEGCQVVEMEAAALMAVAHFRKVVLGQVVYGGDDLSGSEWDDRNWHSRADIRERLFWLAAEACLEL